MKLYPGLLVLKIKSDRVAQVSGVDRTHAYLYWSHNESQTEVARERFNRTKEWKSV